MYLLNRIKDLEKKNAELEHKLNALISCLYPNTIGIDDVQFIEKESKAENDNNKG